MEPTCVRICVSYIITTMLLTCFIYFVISMGMRNTRGLNRLREEIDDISHQLRNPANECPGAKKFGAGAVSCPPFAGGATCAPGADNREITNTIESMLKRKLANIMDDLYNLKKQLAGQGCQFFSGGTKGDPKDGGGGVAAKLKCEPNCDGGSMAAMSRVNFAAEELGARVLSAEAKPIGGFSLVRSFLGLDYCANAPINLLRPSLMPGSCFGFQGAKGAITVKLAKEICVESIVLTHVPKEVTPSQCTTSAPRDFCLYGVIGKPTGGNRVLVGKFTYDNAPRKLAQEFPIKDKRKFSAIRLEFTSNHGNPNFTCIYRLEVHGRMA